MCSHNSQVVIVARPPSLEFAPSGPDSSYVGAHTADNKQDVFVLHMSPQWDPFRVSIPYLHAFYLEPSYIQSDFKILKKSNLSQPLYPLRRKVGMAPGITDIVNIMSLFNLFNLSLPKFCMDRQRHIIGIS